MGETRSRISRSLARLFGQIIRNLIDGWRSLSFFHLGTWIEADFTGQQFGLTHGPSKVKQLRVTQV